VDCSDISSNNGYLLEIEWTK